MGKDFSLCIVKKRGKSLLKWWMDFSEKLELSSVFSLSHIIEFSSFCQMCFHWLTAVSEDRHLYPLSLPLFSVPYFFIFLHLPHFSWHPHHPFIFFCFRTFLKFVICLSIDLNIHMIFSKSVWQSTFFSGFFSDHLLKVIKLQILNYFRLFGFCLSIFLLLPLTPPPTCLTVVLHSGSVPLPMSGCDLCMSE